MKTIKYPIARPIFIAFLCVLNAACEKLDNERENNDAPSLSVVEKSPSGDKLSNTKNAAKTNALGEKQIALKVDKPATLANKPDPKFIGKWAISEADCKANIIFILTNDGKYIRDEEDGNWKVSGDKFTIITINDEMVNDKPTQVKRNAVLKIQQINSENAILQREDGSNVLWQKCDK